MLDRVTFLERPKSGNFTPIYDPFPDETTVSVNAGHPALFVGGGTINMAFGQAFEQVGVECNLFDTVHKAVLTRLQKKLCLMKEALGPDQAVLGVSTFYSMTESFPSVTTCFGRLPSQAPRGPEKDNCGLVLIDIMDRNSRPLRSSKKPQADCVNNNVGMLYVVGPQGSHYSNDEDFIHDLRLTGQNVIESLNEYNSLKGSFQSGEAADPDKVERIQRVRVCLISGGAFKRATVPTSSVARALIDGISSAFSEELTPHIEFAYSNGDFIRNKSSIESKPGQKVEKNPEHNKRNRELELELD